MLRSGKCSARLSNRGSSLAMAVIMAGALLHTGCDQSMEESMVQGTARLLKGPTPPSGVSGVSSAVIKAVGWRGVLGDGNWFISPNKVRVTLVSLGFYEPDGGLDYVDLPDCVVTYDRDAPSLSIALECPFEVIAGTYSAVALVASTTYEVLIDDSLNGIYTDPNAPSLVATTKPAGGAQFVTVTSTYREPIKEGVAAHFPEPVEFSPEVSPTIDILLHGLHTMGLIVAGDNLELKTGEAAFLITVPGGAGKSTYYSNAPTALSYNTSTNPPSTSFIVVYDYESPVNLIYACPEDPRGCFFGDLFPDGDIYVYHGAVDYLTLDDNGVLCAGIHAHYDFQQRLGLIKMQIANSVGETTTLSGQAMSEIPEPADGISYASGCPVITPDLQTDITLLAN